MFVKLTTKSIKDAFICLFLFKTIGPAVVLVLPKPDGGFKVVGVGTVAVMEGCHSDVPILVISVEPDSQDIIKLQQFILWPRKLLAIPEKPTTTQTTLQNEMNASDEKKKSTRQTIQLCKPVHSIRCFSDATK